MMSESFWSRLSLNRARFALSESHTSSIENRHSRLILVTANARLKIDPLNMWTLVYLGIVDHMMSLWVT